MPLYFEWHEDILKNPGLTPGFQLNFNLCSFLLWLMTLPEIFVL